MHTAIRLTVSLFLLLITAALMAPPLSAKPPESASQPEITVSVRSSPGSELRTTIHIRSKKWTAWFKKLQPANRDPGLAALIPYTVTEVSVRNGASGKVLYRWISEDDLLLPANEAGEPAGAPVKPPKGLVRELKSTVAGLEKAHFGKLADWADANRLFPRKAYLTITDLETGLRFRGQRRAGSAHADVQPLTKEDSAVMKRIYGGHWSWNRRAVLISSPEGPVAGSMHGMPHGGDGIPGNGFNGHFCIHFMGCVTHGSGISDPAHQVMVHKAAGKLKEYFTSLTPDGIVDVFLAVSNQKDAHLLGLLLMPGSESNDTLKREWLDEGLTVRRTESPERENETLQPSGDEQVCRLQTKIHVWRRGSRSQTVPYIWTFEKLDPTGPWMIRSIDPQPDHP